MLTERAPIARMLRPSSIAIVGLSDSNPRMIEGLGPTFESGCEIFVVNPRYERVAGRVTAKSLADLDRPIDCVLSVMGAERSTELAEEAATLDIGGMVLVASGFAETGPDGARLQERVRAAATAGGYAAVGPNGLGYENVPRGIRLTIAVREVHRAGGISVVSQSGAMLTGVTMGGNALGAGLNVLVSCGNEAVTDMADFVGFLADDPATKAIGLVIEKVRRPDVFFAAVDRAVAAGKPVVAIKLARSERTRRMAASHTGSLTGDAWVYDVALRQHGVCIAGDAEEAAQRLALVDKIPAARWTAVRSLAVVSRTGGFASQAYDVAAQEGIAVPDLDRLLPWLQQTLPAVRVANPLDVAGGASRMRDIFDGYLASEEVDALFVPQPMSEHEDHARQMASDLGDAAKGAAKPVVLSNVYGLPPSYVTPFEGDALALGAGVRASMRGLDTIGSFVRYRERERAPLVMPAPLARPADATISQPGGEMLPFDATMRILSGAGIPVAPYVLVAPDADARATEVPFAGPYVAKLANVAHRTEHGAVRLGVTREALDAEVRLLREVARAEGLSPVVAVQPMIAASGEVLMGIQGESELGPLVVFGLGGIFVEALGRIGGRMAPFDQREACDLIDEFKDAKIMHGFRGRPAWDQGGLARILASVSLLAAAGRGWISSLDLNPVLYGPSGYTAVDAVLFVRPPAAG